MIKNVFRNPFVALAEGGRKALARTFGKVGEWLEQFGSLGDKAVEAAEVHGRCDAAMFSYPNAAGAGASGGEASLCEDGGRVDATEM